MSDTSKAPTIHDLYPDLSPEEQEEAQNTIHEYIKLVKRIHDRLESEGKLDDVLEQIRKQQTKNTEKKKS